MTENKEEGTETSTEEDWLPEETKRKVAQRPDYQGAVQPCSACE